MNYMKNNTQCSNIVAKEIDFKEIMYFTQRKWWKYILFSFVKLKLTGGVVQLPVTQTLNEKPQFFTSPV